MRPAMSAADLLCRFGRVRGVALDLVWRRKRCCPCSQDAPLNRNEVVRSDEISDLLDRVLRARALQRQEQQRAHELRRGSDEVRVPGENVQPGQVLALNEDVVRNDDGPGLAIQKDL